MKISAHVSWPSAPLTDSLVRKALKNSGLAVHFSANDDLETADKLLQWSTYDDLDHELTALKRSSVLASSYTFRKALIRKHFLSRIIQGYITKQPESLLKNAFPKTYEIEVSYADELDEMWTDELWEVGKALEKKDKWWILKPSMADRGMGIRLFHTKQEIQEIFESFEEDSDDEVQEEEEELSTTIVASQLRHFVIQEYIQNPLLLNSLELHSGTVSSDVAIARKFHLRAYCIASGAISLYLYTRVLALFSSENYRSPSDTPFIAETGQLDLRPHLTNSSLQTELGESNVRLLDELEDSIIISAGSGKDMRLSRSDIDMLVKQMSDVLAETFKAALQNPIHFQVLPNAFELFGVDFLVEHDPNNATTPYQIKLLEINSEPAIELTGPRLTWILEDLFSTVAKLFVKPFFTEAIAGGATSEMPSLWEIGEVREHFMKCLGETVRQPE
ncbi:tubulin-tyrosine ligase family-domain-containing protein [Crepidotus variabilis]|uniref:Tubulin-tyrosine ligase family-domain-containing protein n=1 Tax=Crepidotus variabilis TaxID=179855 RepID=A0A9P6EVJ1_9AGAR|nr:tubulin-tyrosine ligase family-domain-containing protein [Crepidotus variabilis]